MRPATRVRPFLVIPVKSSVGSKQRLSGSLGDPERELLSLALATRAVGLAARVWPAGRRVVVTSDPGFAEACRRLRVAVVADPGAGQTAAVRVGAAWCLERGATVLATVAADLPTVSAGDLELVLRRCRTLGAGAVLAFPDRAGTGTNGLLVRPASLLVHAFGPDSRRRHQRMAAALGLRFAVELIPGLAWDVDRSEDLEPSAADAGTPHPVVPWARSRALPAAARELEEGQSATG